MTEGSLVGARAASIEPLATPVRSIATVTGVVRAGLQLGRKLGFPTANVELPQDLQIAHGVYAVRCEVGERKGLQGVASVGRNPTVPKSSAHLEVWLFDFSADIYGERLTTELLVHLREERCFRDLPSLTRQVHLDAAQARRALSGMVCAGMKLG